MNRITRYNTISKYNFRNQLTYQPYRTFIFNKWTFMALGGIGFYYYQNPKEFNKLKDITYKNFEPFKSKITSIYSSTSDLMNTNLYEKNNTKTKDSKPKYPDPKK